MRFPKFPLVLCFLVFALLGQGAWAQEEPETFPEGYKTAIGEAGVALREKRFDDALKALDKADKEKANTSMAYNLRGAVYTEMKNYPKAQEFFEKAKGVAPQQFAPQFNIAELLFVQKKYKEARSAFAKLQAAFPKEELLEFKIFLTYLLDGTEEEAKARLDAIKWPSNTPAYYFAHAAWAFKHQDLKNAQSYIQSSLNIFPMNQNEIFIESIEDLGWITKNDGNPAGGAQAPASATGAPASTVQATSPAAPAAKPPTTAAPAASTATAKPTIPPAKPTSPPAAKPTVPPAAKPTVKPGASPVLR